MGTVGKIYGFLIKSNFLTVKTPPISPNGTATVIIKGKEYISKHYHYWSKLDRLILIPLEEGHESQVDILNISDVEN